MIAAVACMYACDPQEWLEHHDTDWFVKNKTDFAIKVRIKRSLHWNSESIEVIMPKDSVNILPYHPNIEESPDFSIFLKCMISMTLYDANGDSLTTWDITHQMNRQGICSMSPTGTNTEKIPGRTWKMSPGFSTYFRQTWHLPGNNWPGPA